MSNFSLATVEGSGNFLPAGSVVSLVSTLPRVFEADGVLYSKDKTPAYAIPNFSTKVPSYLKGRVATPSFITFMPATWNSGNTGAGVANDGTIIRVNRSTASITIDRKLPTDSQFYLVTDYLPYTADAATQSAMVVTDNAGKWCAALGGAIHTSLDNGTTWKSIVITNVLEGIKDLRVGPTGTLIMVAKKGNAAGSVIYRSTDFGLTWVMPETGDVTFASVTNTGGSTWAAIIAGSTTTYTSSDDGLTWGTGPTLVTAAVSVANKPYIYWTNGRYYMRYSGVVHTGVSLSALAIIGGLTGITAVGVDNVGNCLVVTDGGLTHKSTNGSSFVATISRASSQFSGYVYTLQFANGTWVDKGGSWLTNADIAVGGKSWTTWEVVTGATHNQSSFSLVSDADSLGVSLIVLNHNSYLRTTDNWETWELRNFNVLVTNSSPVHPTGVATDNHGGWAVTYNGSSNILYSSDGGLTWTTKVNTLVDTSAIAGGKAPGVFCTRDLIGTAGRYTNNGFASTTTITGGSGSSASSNIVYVNSGFFVTFGWDGSANCSMRVVNSSTGVSMVHSLNQLPADLSNSKLILTDGNVVYFSDKMYTSISTVKPPTEATATHATQTGNGGVIDGYPSNTYGTVLQTGTNTMVPRNPTRTANFWKEGIPSLSLTATQYIKVN